MSRFYKYGAVAFLLSLFFCVFQEVNTDDETWFLQVVNRVLSGDTLYRDVFFGATPLSVYISAFFAKILGSELLVMRGVLALYFVISILISCAILKELHVKNPYSFLFFLSFFIFAHFQAAFGYSGYNALSKLFFLPCLYFSLRWLKRLSHRHLALAAGFAGLCFCSKQNVGALAFLCILSVLLVTKKARVKQLMVVCFSSLSVIVFCLFPTWIQGGWDAFIDYGFLNKKNYIHLETDGYFVVPHPWNHYSVLILVAPFLLLLLLFLYKRTKNVDLHSKILWIFLIGSIVNLYPRPTNDQKMICIPFFLITIVYLYDRIPIKWKSQIKIALCCWFGIALIFLVKKPLIPFLQKEHSLSVVPHFRGIAMETNCHLHWANMKKQFSAEFDGNNFFFLSTHAGFYYLLFDLHNPTPFDYPIHTAYGLSGEQKVVEMIKNSHINTVIQDHPHWSNWWTVKKRRPFQLEKTIAETMTEEPLIEEGSLKRVFQVYAQEIR